MRLFFVIALFSTSVCLANDGAFYARGNQLIPIVETDISVQKEVLTIKRIANDYLRVTVSYIFNNPTTEKELLVGFEAASPSGDVDGAPKNGQHPYMSNFSVNMNGLPIRYEAAIVNTVDYYRDGKVQHISAEKAMGDAFNPNDPDFYYVYHFKAKFKPGINTIRHTYNFKLSSSVMENYSFQYILTAANRWANNGIDDFTLIIDLGDFQDFLLSKSFFKNTAEWALDGKMQEFDTEKAPPYQQYYKNHVRVFSNGGALVFTRKNFRPKGELSISCPRSFSSDDVFDPATVALAFDLFSNSHFKKSVNENAYKILRNLPYARRGYVFKTQFIQMYYEKQPWYMPNPNYVSNRDDLTDMEKKWLSELVAP